MCIGKGFIAVKGNDKLLYEMDSNDHAPIIDKHNLKDDVLINRNFVKLEAHPLDSLTSIEIKDWKINIDETGTLPSWFEEEKDVWITRCINEMIDIIIPSWCDKGINGSLDLRGTQVKDLGKLERVRGFLYLQGTQVKDLGNLKECGSLYLRGTQVKDLGNLKECGSLDLRGTQVKDLGNLKECGSLDLRGTQVKDLGKLERVRDYLYLRGTQVIKGMGRFKDKIRIIQDV